MRKTALYSPMLCSDKAWAAWKKGEEIDPADVSWRVILALDDDRGSTKLTIAQRFDSLDEAFATIKRWFPDIENDRSNRLYEGSPF